MAPKPNAVPVAAVVVVAPKPVPRVVVPNRGLFVALPTWFAPKAPNPVAVLDGVPNLNPTPVEG